MESEAAYSCTVALYWIYGCSPSMSLYDSSCQTHHCLPSDLRSDPSTIRSDRATIMHWSFLLLLQRKRERCDSLTLCLCCREADSPG
jgi:hypothetical protein